MEALAFFDVKISKIELQKWAIKLERRIGEKDTQQVLSSKACRYVFENSDIIRIFAHPFAHNEASCRVLEKAGFFFEGTLHCNAVKNGKILDMKMYALIKH